MWPADAEVADRFYQRHDWRSHSEPLMCDPSTAGICSCWVCFRVAFLVLALNCDQAWSAAAVIVALAAHLGGATVFAQHYAGALCPGADGIAARAADGGGRPRAGPRAGLIAAGRHRPVIIREGQGWRCTWATSWTSPPSGVTHRPPSRLQ